MTFTTLRITLLIVCCMPVPAGHGTSAQAAATAYAPDSSSEARTLLRQASAVLRATRGFSVSSWGRDKTYHAGRLMSAFLWTARARISLRQNRRSEDMLYSIEDGASHRSARQHRYLARFANFRMQIKEDAGPWRCWPHNDQYSGAVLPLLSPQMVMSIITTHVAGRTVIHGIRVWRIVSRLRQQPASLPPITVTDYITPDTDRLLRETVTLTMSGAGGLVDMKFHRVDIANYGETVRVTIPTRCRQA
jgi:hypothetical protein